MKTTRELKFNKEWLPAKANYIHMSPIGIWYWSIKEPVKKNGRYLFSDDEPNLEYNKRNIDEFYAPTNFKGSHSDSLFKVE